MDHQSTDQSTAQEILKRIWSKFSLSEKISVTFVLFCIAFLTSMKAKEMFSSTGDLYMCPEPIQVSGCSVKRSGTENTYLDCLLTNKAYVMVNPSVFSVWNYDKNGIFIETSYIQSSVTVPPNETAHIEVWVRNDASKSIICSMDPRSTQLIKVD